MKSYAIKSSAGCLIVAVEKALNLARANGLKIGDTVCHPKDDYIYTLCVADGNIATVKISAAHNPGEKEITKEFPLDQLFDFNTAKEIAIQLAKKDSYYRFVLLAMRKTFL